MRFVRFFFFGKSHVQIEYGGNDLVEVSGSKLASIVFQIVRKKFAGFCKVFVNTDPLVGLGLGLLDTAEVTLDASKW